MSWLLLKFSRDVKVEIPTPQGQAESERDALIQKAIDVEMALDEELDDYEWLDDPPEVANSRTQSEPPADAWADIGGHRWATDGACAIRFDAPRPGAPDGFREWLAVAPEWVAGLAKILASVGPGTCGHRFARRFAPLLSGGDSGVAQGSAGVANSAAAVLLDGETIAIVMPFIPGYDGPSVDVRGNP